MQIIEDAPILRLTDESSMDDIRSLVVDGKSPEPKEPAAEPEGKEPVAEAQEEPEEPEVELPKGVQKRIEKETQRQAEFQRIIDEARSKTKALEAEAAKLNGAGAEPDKKTPKADENARPEPPDFDTFEGTGVEFKAALKKFTEDDKAWLEKQTRATVQQEFQERESQKAAQARWDSALAEHGDKWQSSVDAVVAVAPDSLQNAISAYPTFSKIAVYLAEHPAELTALADQFKANPPGSPGFYLAAGELGRINLQITTAAPKAEAKPALKLAAPPLKRVVADPGEGASHFDPDKADMSQVRSYMQKTGMLKK